MVTLILDIIITALNTCLLIPEKKELTLEDICLMYS